jgi:hypothetical protein
MVLSNGTAFSGPGLVRINGGAVTASAPITFARLEQNDGTLGGTATVTSSGIYAWNGGTQAGPGVTAISPGASLLISNTTFAAMNGRTLRNAGTVVSTSVNFGQDIQFNAGLIENLAGANFEVQGSGGFNDLDGPSSVAEFRNAGTFHRTTAGSALFSGVKFQNTGDVLLDSGTIYLEIISKPRGILC